MIVGLTPRQAEALRWIHGFQIANAGVSPSYCEIAAGLGLRHKSGVVSLVAQLQERGWLHQRANQANAAELLGNDFQMAFLVSGGVLILGLLNGMIPS